MIERQFRPIEEFKGFGDDTTLDQVVDAILEFGPEVIGDKDVFTKDAHGIEGSTRTQLCPLGLSWSAKDVQDPVLSRKHEARNILSDRSA
ncbi:MAG: hypothetical protein Q8P68_03320 [Candidatus Peregrinibacteria bacterium]|nr:hypothetical protein [Candidatus Peregrinibacteria bacterium]MDZ4244799.1 hypothetical protein [Candidatus Gracilibacteria bacterium]